MTAIRLLGRTLLATTALVGATLAPVSASAETLPTATGEPAAERAVSIMHLTVDRGTGSDPYRSALLTCQPAGGTHPEPAMACESLAEAGGNFEALRTGNENALCPLVYRPVTVTATGTWKNTSIKYEQTYPNACVLAAYTGPVFDL